MRQGKKTKNNGRKGKEKKKRERESSAHRQIGFDLWCRGIQWQPFLTGSNSSPRSALLPFAYCLRQICCCCCPFCWCCCNDALWAPFPFLSNAPTSAFSFAAAAYSGRPPFFFFFLSNKTERGEKKEKVNVSWEVGVPAWGASSRTWRL